MAILLYSRSKLKEKPDNPVRDEVPSSSSTRGTFLPLLCGVDRLGPVIGWVGNRFTTSESLGGSKGKSGGGDTTIYWESAWHQICIGPAFKLWEIRENGVVIFEGPIDRFTTPSGTKITIDDGSSFTIFWGEKTGPIPPDPAWLEQVGIASRFPYLCFIHWNPKKLGPATVWSRLDYVVEVRPQNLTIPPLLDSTPWITGKIIFDPDTKFDITRGENGAEGIGFLGFDGGYEDDRFFGIREPFKTLNNQDDVVSEGIVSSKAKRKRQFDDDGDGYKERVYWEHDIYPVSGVVDWTLHKKIQPGAQLANEGANPAHILNQILFERWPHGIALDRSEWDISSLETLGVQCANDGLQSHMLVQEGNNLAAVLDSILNDISAVLFLNPTNGLWTFKALRVAKQSDTVYTIPLDAIVSSPPEFRASHEDRPATKVVFTYTDRWINFREKGVSEYDDGEGALGFSQKQKKVELFLPRAFGPARRMAKLRSQVDLINTSTVIIQAVRDAVAVIPGTHFYIEGSPYLFRALTLKLSPDSSVVEIGAINDILSVGIPQIGDELDEEFNPPGSGVEPDIDDGIYEVSRLLVNSENRSTIVPLRWRSGGSVDRAAIYFSGDASTYFALGSTNFAHAGGYLLEDIGEDAPTLWEEGFLFTPEGFDALNVVDYSSDRATWHSGVQSLVIDEELFLVRNITVINATTVRAQGIIRARSGSKATNHFLGAKVFIVHYPRLSTFSNAAFTEGQTIYFKFQPFSGNNGVPLSEVPAITHIMKAPSARPGRVGALLSYIFAGDPNTFNRGIYRTGQSVSFAWSYRAPDGGSNGTGAGFQPAGQATGVSAFEGTFTARIRDGAGTLIREVRGIASTGYVYPNAEIVADFGGEPSEFVFEIINVLGARESDPESIKIVKV